MLSKVFLLSIDHEVASLVQLFSTLGARDFFFVAKLRCDCTASLQKNSLAPRRDPGKYSVVQSRSHWDEVARRRRKVLWGIFQYGGCVVWTCSGLAPGENSKFAIYFRQLKMPLGLLSSAWCLRYLPRVHLMIFNKAIWAKLHNTCFGLSNLVLNCTGYQFSRSVVKLMRYILLIGTDDVSAIFPFSVDW